MSHTRRGSLTYRRLEVEEVRLIEVRLSIEAATHKEAFGRVHESMIRQWRHLHSVDRDA